MGTIAILATSNANDNDVGDLLIAAKGMLQHSKNAFDYAGDTHASRMMIAPLNCIGIAIDRLLAQKTRDAALVRRADELPTAAQFGKVIYDVSVEVLQPNFDPIGIKQPTFEELDERTRNLHVAFGAAVLKLLTK